jgi:hypothetical protein
VFFLAILRRDIRAAAKRFGRNDDISANQLIAYPVTKGQQQALGQRRTDRRLAAPESR